MPTNKSKYIFRFIFVFVALLIIGIVYFLFSPEESNLFPQCPFHSLTGLDCPGCGSQRAIHYLLHFNLKAAFFSNPLLLIFAPYLLLGIYMEYFGGKERYPNVQHTLYGKKAMYIAFFLILLFWIGRNLFTLFL